MTDRTTASEHELIRALARRADAVIAGVSVRIASYSGRVDLSPSQISLLDAVAAQNTPFAAVCFGNPYTATFLPKLPTVLLGYEFSDFTVRAAVMSARGRWGTCRAAGLPVHDSRRDRGGLTPSGHGNWVRIGTNRYAFTAMRIRMSGSTFVGLARFWGTITAVSDDELTGTMNAQFYSPDGTPTSPVFAGTLERHRIEVTFEQ